MTVDKKKLYIISSSILVALLLTLFAPMGSGRIIAALLLLPSAILISLLIKKRTALSINSKQVWLIVGIIGLLYLVFYYVSAVYFGLTKTGYGLKSVIIFRFIIPIAIVIVCTEIVRYVLCAQKDKWANVFAYFIALCADVLICATIPAVTNMATFMDVVGLTLFPGLLYNLLYNYLSVRYGFIPIIIYKAFTVWAFYLIPYGSAISLSLVAFINMLLPIAIFIFIDSLFERKRRYALQNTSRFWRVMSKVLTVIVLILMIGTIIIVSNQFYIGAYVIATDSMTGELNKGDVAIYERYEDQLIIEGQVIVFEKNDSVIVHRVADIQIINGNIRYYTKGDTNDNLDVGFITDGDIIGLVTFKLPYFGYPTLWVRSLFER